MAQQEQGEVVELQVAPYDDYSYKVLAAKKLLIEDDLAYMLGTKQFTDLYWRLKQAARYLSEAAACIHRTQIRDRAKEKGTKDENNTPES